MKEQLVFIFFVFSFAGWIIELCFRSVYERRFVNPGFHKGPWLPLYGFAGVVIFLISEHFAGTQLLVRMLFYYVLCTAFELFAGIFLEKVFNRRYWDYSQNRMNIMGLICPLYSAAWVLISIVVEAFILPVIRFHFTLMPPDLIQKADAVLLLIITVDFIFSSGVICGRNINRLKGLFNG